MRRNLTSDGEDGAVGSAAGPSQVIPFRRAAAAHEGSTAGDDPSSSPAIPLGSAVQAVVLKLANKRIRLRVESPSREEEDWGSR
ncbi:hypothetical protein [Ensifer sp. 1H6]|uniref:hypothetical protein n=1 Tax=Ensifer sp. 1H6 TaxID=1911585 RepID=UPI000A0727AF|nr:hypothetical protein [Ensifer sp. 1H6]